MKVIGIIAEYNPFHNGHLHQINKIKELYKDSLIIVVLNGNFTQRGDVSIINKWDKTKILLQNNVDLIVELPVFYGINNADIFAKAAIEILNNLKIDILTFGSESDNLDNLIKVANIKINNEKYDSLVKEALNTGISYPKATFDAIKKLTNINIDTPNDILGISYIEQIIKNKYDITPLAIKRTNDYHDKDLNNISSASAIREALKNNEDISITVPKETLNYLKEPVFIDEYFDLLKYKILSTDDLSIFHDIEEGIENRINKYITESSTLEELIQKVKTKRYTYNRIKRILLYILLDIKKNIEVKNYIRVLGFNKRGQRYLKEIKKDISLPLINKYSDNKEILALEYKCNKIYSLKTKDIEKNIKSELNNPIIK